MKNKICSVDTKYPIICWEIIKKCNYNCNYCIAKEFKNSPNKVPNYHKILSNFNKIDFKFDVRILGGEPLLDINLYKIMLSLCKIPNSNKVYLFTNFSLTNHLKNILVKLQKENLLNKIEIIYSYHPESHNSFFKDILNLSKLFKINYRININIEHNKQQIYYDNIDNIVKKYGNLNLRFHPIIDNNWDTSKPLSKEIMELHIKNPNIKFFNGSEVIYNNVKIEEIDLFLKRGNYNFKGWKCFPKHYHIDENGLFYNSCTLQKIEILTNKTLIKDIICPVSNCTIPIRATFDKEEI